MLEPEWQKVRPSAEIESTMKSDGCENGCIIRGAEQSTGEYIQIQSGKNCTERKPEV